jgi:hypothetical protein
MHVTESPGLITTSPRLDLTVAAATVAGVGIAVVTRFTRLQYAVPADGNYHIRLTVAAAPITADPISIVTRFTRIDDAVGAGASISIGLRCYEGGAVIAAPGANDRVAFDMANVTKHRTAGVHIAVSPAFRLTGAVTSIATGGIAVVTLFPRVDAAVAAEAGDGQIARRVIGATDRDSGILGIPRIEIDKKAAATSSYLLPGDEVVKGDTVAGACGRAGGKTRKNRGVTNIDTRIEALLTR